MHPCVRVRLTLMPMPRWHHHLLPVEFLSGPARPLKHIHTLLLVVRQLGGIPPTDQQLLHTRCDLHHTMVHQHPSQSFCFLLLLDVHVGLISVQKGCLSVFPAASLYAIWLAFLPRIEGTHPHSHQTVFMCVLLRRQLGKRSPKRGVRWQAFVLVCGGGMER